MVASAHLAPLPPAVSPIRVGARYRVAWEHAGIVRRERKPGLRVAERYCDLRCAKSPRESAEKHVRVDRFVASTSGPVGNHEVVVIGARLSAGERSMRPRVEIRAPEGTGHAPRGRMPERAPAPLGCQHRPIGSFRIPDRDRTICSVRSVGCGEIFPARNPRNYCRFVCRYARSSRRSSSAPFGRPVRSGARCFVESTNRFMQGQVSREGFPQRIWYLRERRNSGATVRSQTVNITSGNGS